MATYYVYVTEQCKKDAVPHGGDVSESIEEFAHKLENAQNTHGLARFPNRYLTKKIVGRQGRLVIEECIRGDDIVLCFARYLIRGNADYDLFAKDRQKFNERNGVPSENVDKFLKGRMHEPVKSKLELSDAEQGYLQPTAYDNDTNDREFLESYDWVEQISQDWAKNFLLRYHELVVEVVNVNLPEGQYLLEHPKNTKIKMLFRRFPEHKCTFLIAPIDSNKPSNEKDLREKYGDILSAERVDMEELIRRSRRAYPEIITYDEDIWMRVEKSAEANLALSPEEGAILKSVMTPSSDVPRYPLFINGRPGSGKSTVLQYLFAAHLSCFNKLVEEYLDAPLPIYLTYSTSLLDRARTVVKDILTCGAEHVDSGGSLVSDEVLNKCFKNFRTFMRSLLPPEIQDKFTPANYVDFGRFRKLWDGKRAMYPDREVRDIGAELAWHAIRTFIKGMQHDSGLVDPEYYTKELPRDAKSISGDTFRIIFERVWEKWYEPLCKKAGYWDDQDLARAVLAHSIEDISRYSAVFCDESQDFTNMELEIIEQLSIYSKRQIPSHLIKNIPFAFAGDPFQTLNPTGFNWSKMQSSFHDNIVRQLDPSGEAKLKFNFQELAFNYRSSEHIVKLANLVQLLRVVLLDLKEELRPQQCWTRKATVSPVWFRRGDASCESTIRDQEELVIIVPCRENGEIEYVRGDPFLKSIAMSDDEEISRNILSPVRAKGLEYDRVLLYGFGDDAMKRCPDLIGHIKNPDRKSPEIEQILAWEYSLNQLYVAVSRARKRIFIVDSDKALRNFWSFAEANRQKELLDIYDHHDRWSIEDLGGIVQGDETSWDDDRDDPLELAKQWREQGHSQRDPYLLRLAREGFKGLKMLQEAQICDADQHEYAGEFDKAAKIFADIKQPTDACRCYWAAQNYDAITTLAEGFSEVAANPHFIAAGAITREQNSAPQIGKVLDALDKVEPAPFPDMPGELDAWRQFFESFVGKMADAIEGSDRSEADWKPYVDHLIGTIKRFELPLEAYPDIGKLLHLAGDSKGAIAQWEKCCGRRPDPKREEWAIRAYAAEADYPANIGYYHELGDHKSAIDAWQAGGGVVEKGLPLKRLLDSAMHIGDQMVVGKLLPVCDDLSQLFSVLIKIKKNGPRALRSLRGAIPVAIANSLEVRGDWKQLLNFVSSQSTSNKELNSLIRNSGIEWPRKTLVAATVRVMARSERLASANYRKDIPKFLADLIVDGDTSNEGQNFARAVHELVDVSEIGAAFERAFELKHALQYYGQFLYMSSNVREVYTSIIPVTDGQMDFTRRRWLKCKRSLAELGRGQSGSDHEKEADRWEKKWGISIDKEPEYPSLGVISELPIPMKDPDEGKLRRKDKSVATSASAVNSSPAEGHDISVDANISIDGRTLSAKILRRKGRIVLTDAESENQVTCEPGGVSSGDLEIVKADEHGDVKAWLVKDWNLVCEIETSDNRAAIRLRIHEGPVVVGFELFSG